MSQPPAPEPEQPRLEDCALIVLAPPGATVWVRIQHGLTHRQAADWLVQVAAEIEGMPDE